MKPKGKRTRVLLVDDEAEFLDSTAKALSRRGFEVQQAENGELALRMLEKRQTIVAVLDVKMPGMDGVDVFREIKLRWPSIAVIMLTGHGSVGQAFATSKEGVVEYLAKPCDIDKLAAVIRKAAASVPGERCETDKRDRKTPMSLSSKSLRTMRS